MIFVMQGFERMDRGLLDAAAVGGHLVPGGRMFAVFGTHRGGGVPGAA